MDSNLNLNLEEAEQLVDLLDMPGYKVLLKVMDKVSEEKLSRVVNYTLESGNDRELAILKARHEGSLQTVRALQQLLLKIKRSRLEN